MEPQKARQGFYVSLLAVQSAATSPRLIIQTLWHHPSAPTPLCPLPCQSSGCNPAEKATVSTPSSFCKTQLDFICVYAIPVKEQALIHIISQWAYCTDVCMGLVINARFCESRWACTAPPLPTDITTTVRQLCRNRKGWTTVLFLLMSRAEWQIKPCRARPRVELFLFSLKCHQVRTLYQHFDFKRARLGF